MKNILTECDDAQDAMRIFMDRYGVSRQKAEMALGIAVRELELVQGIEENDICLYIGVPFCKSRCLYCSFVTYSTGGNNRLIDDYVPALIREIRYTAELIKRLGLRVVAVYMGGGTPTTLSAAQLTEVIEEMRRCIDLSASREFTVEAGRPDTIDEDKLKALRQGGVTRISINPQSMKEETLALIGRRHSPQQVRESFAMAREYGFDHINMDLIAGLPGETLEDFEYSLEEVERLAPESTTVHTMSIKRGSLLHEKLGDYALTDGATVARMVDYARERLAKAGKEPYYLYRQKNILGNLENVGYTKDGCACLYNILMMSELSTVVSVGAGGATKAIGRNTGKISRIFNVKEAVEYINRVDQMCHRKDCLEELLRA